MFENVGGKIKTLAKVTTWIGIIASIIVGFGVMFTQKSGGGFLMGLLIMAVGSFASWLASLSSYAFGQLVENSDILVMRTRASSPTPPLTASQTLQNNPTAPKTERTKMEKLKALIELRNAGVITADEYEEKAKELQER